MKIKRKLFIVFWASLLFLTSCSSTTNKGQNISTSPLPSTELLSSEMSISSDIEKFEEEKHLIKKDFSSHINIDPSTYVVADTELINDFLFVYGATGIDGQLHPTACNLYLICWDNKEQIPITQLLFWVTSQEDVVLLDNYSDPSVNAIDGEYFENKMYDFFRLDPSYCRTSEYYDDTNHVYAFPAFGPGQPVFEEINITMDGVNYEQNEYQIYLTITPSNTELYGKAVRTCLVVKNSEDGSFYYDRYVINDYPTD